MAASLELLASTQYMILIAVSRGRTEKALLPCIRLLRRKSGTHAEAYATVKRAGCNRQKRDSVRAQPWFGGRGRKMRRDPCFARGRRYVAFSQAVPHEVLRLDSAAVLLVDSRHLKLWAHSSGFTTYGACQCAGSYRCAGRPMIQT